MENEAVMSELKEAMQRQTALMEHMLSLLHNDLQEIKYLLSLTPVYPMRYHMSQENFGGQNQGMVLGPTTITQKRSKDRPPFVPKGESVKCVRCEYEWTPQSRYPQKCPNCRSPWWFPPKWRWSRNSDANKESSD